MVTLRRRPDFAQRYGLFLLAVLAPSQHLAGKDVMRNSSRECAICHIRWVDAFDRADAQDGRMQTVIDRQTGSGDMCLSCHDGSTIDSRFKVWSTHHHTTDHVPSPSVHIPTEKFPLDAEGRMTCATCHTAHAVPDNSDIATVIFLRQPNIDSSLCLACHADHTQKDGRHHPLGPTDAPIPKAILDAGGKTAADGRTIICQTCHEPHGARNAWMLVLPPSELCIACHAGKSPDATPMAGAPVHKIGRAYPGFMPPASLLDRKATFGPGGELTCLSCHRLHDASGAWPLLIQRNDDSSLCLECHEREKAVLGSAHDLRASSPQTVNAGGETPSTSGPCGACHRIHGWARNVPDANSPHSAGCMECHTLGGPGFANRPYIEAHPVGVAIQGGKSVPLPLDQATGTVGCLTCHDPHVPHPADETTEPVAAAEEQPAPGRGPRSFLRREGSQLCVLCHDETAASLHGVHDPARFAPAVREALALNPSVGTCGVCHTTHNARGPHLSARAPAGPGADLCDACHGTPAVKVPGETRHPASVSHVKSPPAESNGDDTGCGACHDPHGTSTVLLRRPLEGLCIECHKDKGGMRGSVHDPRTSEWGQKLGYVSKELCVDCHPIHGPRGRGGLWGSLPGNGAGEQSCKACHREDAPGPTMKTPHMGKSLRPSTGTPNARQTSGIHPAQSTIDCGTCHEIHQSGRDPLLLRVTRQDSRLCLWCHAELGRLLGTSHDLRQSGPEVRNLRGEIAAESGPCSSCHLIHPTPNGHTTWAQNWPSQQSFGNGYCTCCHREEGCAKDCVPTFAGHPQVAVTNRLSSEHPDYMPTFNEQGEPSRVGGISCPTCHDLHSTAKVLDATGQSARPEGVFLRTTARKGLCIDCHGFEALWRFLYYHRSERNPRPIRGASPPAADPARQTPVPDANSR